MKRYKSVDLTLLICVVMLVFIGIVMVFSSSYYVALALEGNKFHYLQKELLWVSVGFVALVITMNIDYHFYRKFSWPLIVGSVVLLVLLFTPLGKTVNGATRWLDLGPATLMPSEVTKLGVIIFVADQLDKRRSVLHQFKKGFFPFIALIGLLALLIIKQPNLSTAITISVVILAMMFIAGARLHHLMGLVAAGVGAVTIAIMLSPYRLKRFLTFLDPFKDTQGDGYQVVQSLYALGTGGMFGVGLGQSTLNKLYIPEPQNDFIFATIGEELGWIGCVFILMIFLTLIYRGVKIAINAPDLFGSLVAAGITALVSIQVIINLAVATSSMPVTGLPLPFISYGGNFLLLLLVLMGVLLNISKKTIERNDKDELKSNE